MSDITKEELVKEIHAILKDADLSVLSAKKVRLELEKVLGCELLSRKKEIDAIAMDYINSQEMEEDEDEDEDEQDEPVSRKRTSNNKTTSPIKKKKTNDSDDETAYKPSEFKSFRKSTFKKSAPASKKKGGRKRGSASDNDSDEDYVKPKAPPRKKAAPGSRPKGTGFTRAVALSPQLAELMGAESLPRHEVVKKMWSIIKEKNLYCPKNKQFAICDEALYKVMGVKRFRTFGMLKYLKSHFVD